MKIMECLRNKKGIETKPLVFILAAVVLILLVGVVVTMMNSANELVDSSIGYAKATLNATNITA